MDDTINYADLIDEAMHDVVRKALHLVSVHGLPQDHHFFITFNSQHPEVMMSPELLRRYPEEMTIVMQHQFWDLEVEDTQFSIVLSFENVKQNITVPFDALISFADPSVKFGLQFHNGLLDEADLLEHLEELEENNSPVKSKKSDGSNVIALDSFRTD